MSQSLPCSLLPAPFPLPPAPLLGSVMYDLDFLSDLEVPGLIQQSLLNPRRKFPGENSSAKIQFKLAKAAKVHKPLILIPPYEHSRSIYAGAEFHHDRR